MMCIRLFSSGESAVRLPNCITTVYYPSKQPALNITRHFPKPQKPRQLLIDMPFSSATLALPRLPLFLSQPIKLFNSAQFTENDLMSKLTLVLWIACLLSTLCPAVPAQAAVAPAPAKREWLVML